MTYQELINKLTTLSPAELSQPAFAYAGEGDIGIEFIKGVVVPPLYKLVVDGGKLKLQDNNPKD